MDPDGRVCSGRLVTNPQRKGEEGPILMSRTGHALRPTDVLALLALRPITEDQNADLTLAIQAGFRVEEM